MSRLALRRRRRLGELERSGRKDNGGREQGDSGRQSRRGSGSALAAATAAKSSTCASPRRRTGRTATATARKRPSGTMSSIFNENLGRVAKSYLRKGSKVYLEGQIQTRKWQDQSGNDSYSTEVVLQRFRGELVLLDSRGEGGGSAAASAAAVTATISAAAAAAAPSANSGRSRRRSTPTSTTTFRSRSWSRIAALQLGQRRERAGFRFAQHARFLERRLGARAARIGVERQRQRVGDRAAEIDRRAVVENHVAIGSPSSISSSARRLRARAGNRCRTASSTCAATGSPVTTQLCTAPALTRPAARTISPFRSRIACASSRSSERSAEPVGDRQALPFVGGKIDSLAVADPVERKPVGEILAHDISPWERSSSSVAANRCHRVRSADSLWRSGIRTGRFVAVEASPDLLRPVRIRADERRATRSTRPAMRRPAADLLAERRVAEADLAKLRVHGLRRSVR